MRLCSSHALCLLGSAQLALADSITAANHAAALLDDARQSFAASIALEGSPTTGELRPELTGPSTAVIDIHQTHVPSRNTYVESASKNDVKIC